MKRQDPISLVILVVVLIPYLTDHQDSAKNSPSFFFALFLRKSIIFIFFTGPLGGGSSITKTQYCSFYRICQIHLQFFVGGIQKSSSTCTKTELTKWFRRATLLGGKAQWRIACGRRVGGNRPMRSLLSMSEHHWAPIRGQSVPSVWTLSINKSYLICRG